MNNTLIKLRENKIPLIILSNLVFFLVWAILKNPVIDTIALFVLMIDLSYGFMYMMESSMNVLRVKLFK